MKKKLLALGAFILIAVATLATPTPSRANGLVVAAIVVGAVIATVVVVQAVARPSYVDGDHRRWHRHHHRHRHYRG